MTNDDQIRELKAQRGVLKTKLTKFGNYISDASNRDRKTEIKLRLQRIEPILDEFESFTDQIDALSGNVSNDFEDFEKTFFNIISEAHDLCRDTPDQSAPRLLHRAEPNAVSANDTPQLRLPPIELTTFDGTFDKWLSFYNQFNSMVHENANISEIQKFYYLKSCLKNEAAEIISSLELTDANYTVACQLLKDRYDNKRVIIQKHVRALMDLPSVAKESTTELRKFIDSINTHLRALKSLGQPTASWDTLLIHAFTAKLDRVAHQEWERSVTGSEMPQFSDFLSFLEQRYQILQITNINLAGKVTAPAKSNGSKKQVFAATQSSDACAICQGSHKLYACETFRNLSVKERLEKIKSNKLCFNCFKPGHPNSECKWSGCKKCGKKHNTMLHYENKETSSQDDKPDTNKSDANFNGLVCKAYSAVMSPQTVLSTAMVNVKNKDGELVRARVLLDSGAQSNFMTERFAEILRLPREKIDIPVETLNQVETRVKYSMNAEIQSRCTGYKTVAEFLLLPSICNRLPNEYIDKRVLNLPAGKPLADPEFNKPKQIDALIGVELFFHLLSVGQEKVPGTSVLWQKTQLGWVLAGKLSTPTTSTAPVATNNTKCMLTFNSLHKSVNRFWELEELPEKRFLSEEECKVEKHFSETTTRDPQTGRYTVRLPFNERISNLGESRKIAERQFYSLERKFIKNPELKSDYVQSMREALELGHMIPIEDQAIRDKHCFLPYHVVFKESSSTTKRRIVNNASAKTSTGISLNDCLMVGAVVQSGSFDLTLRFREHQIVLLADIEKMYKQVKLHPDDAQYQLVLWRENEHELLKAYMIPVVLFGSASAQHSATRVLNQLADDERANFPLASHILKRDCYVDDILTGANTVEEALTLRDELIGLATAGGFTLRKWISNDVRVVETLPDTLTSIDLWQGNAETKALGIQWDRVADEITYKVTENFDQRITKRTILSSIARLYDPIGLIGPVIVKAKLVMQALWQSEIAWDETVPQGIYAAWSDLKAQLPKLNEIKFARKVAIQNAARVELHGFCDSSEKAYGACLYIRSVDKDGNTLTNLVCSKNRVAPLKTVTLPKLELCAAHLLSQLAKTFLNATTLKFDDIVLWSDSSITLQWISMQPYLLKTFVANRVSEIRDATKGMFWRHVPTADNVADILSRGMSPSDLINHKVWQTGPTWLRESSDEWPQNIVCSVPTLELRPTQVIHLVTHKNELITKYSSIHKLKRVMAFIFRFKHNALHKKYPESGPRLSGVITVSELNRAMQTILKLTQNDDFSEDVKQLSANQNVLPRSQLRALNPYMDVKGLIRVGGRLNNSALPESNKHPIVLPKEHHVTKLIVEDYHKLNLHTGVQATLYAVRARYWPLNGKNAIKAAIGRCATCFKANPSNCAHIMGDLPSSRVTQARPFSNVGLDYCGPFYVKEKKLRNRGKVKVYACIFVCFATKAIHIEIVSDLTTEAFLACLHRFFARRGLAANLYSDNATNFVGARNEFEVIKKLIKSEAHNETVKEYISNLGVNWHFSPPRAPHFGGIWEAAVKSFKFHFYRVVGEHLFTYEELNTYAIMIEAVLNSRPITPMSQDPNDLRALSPAHFLIGDSLTSLPQLDYTDTPTNRLSSWEHIQSLKQHFWRRWSKEYLNQLNTRSKWQFKAANTIKVGSLVLLKEDNAPSLLWPLGRIVEVFPGKDGVVRVVSVKTKSGVYKRSVTCVAPLPIE